MTEIQYITDYFTDTDDKLTNIKDNFTNAEDKFINAEENITNLGDNITNLGDNITNLEDSFIDIYDNFTSTNLIIPIDNSTSYAKFSNFYVDHNLNYEQTENLLKNLDVGSWILWNYTEHLNNIKLKLNAITIKISDGLVHHNKFIFRLTNKFNDVLEVNLRQTLSNDNLDEKKIYANKSYNTMKEYLEKLSEIYGLDLDKQIIYEDD